MTEPVTLGSYVIYTDNENSTQICRNPVEWKLYATNDDKIAAMPADTIPYIGTSASALRSEEELEAAGWVCIDYVFDGNMKDVDCMPYGYKIDEAVQGAYKHYCWFIDDNGGESDMTGVTGLKLFAAENAASGDAPSPEVPRT